MKRCLCALAAALLVWTAQGQDVVRLARYQNENAALGAPARGEKRVILYGDSITEGWVTWAGDFFRDGRIGRGISGEVTAQMLLRFRQDVIDLHPKTVVILAGTNDIALNLGAYNPDYTLGNLADMVELAKAHKIKVILCSVLPAAGFAWRKEVSDAPEKIADLNQRIRALAREKKVPFVDYFPALVAADGRSLNPAYSPDGVHPNPEGYAVMAEILLKALK